ncbi:MAG: hypothetical protein OXQ94_14720 [Gemmatimonadota bacterium]|nr:hypothetical protein [Gemmatimonadota bacterium]MDE2872928.1 hypothetical protein [Gemmatimonadota bacterium]
MPAGALAWIASPGDIAARVATFLALLDPDARVRATYDLAHEERLNWLHAHDYEGGHEHE